MAQVEIIKQSILVAAISKDAAHHRNQDTEIIECHLHFLILSILFLAFLSLAAVEET